MRPKSAQQTRRRRVGKPESAPSRETFSKRTRKPGSVGLANEARPGLGTRANDPAPEAAPEKPPKEARTREKPRATKMTRETPRPAPREQSPNSLAHEEERSTGMSGQSSGV